MLILCFAVMLGLATAKFDRFHASLIVLVDLGFSALSILERARTYADRGEAVDMGYALPGIVLSFAVACAVHLTAFWLAGWFARRSRRAG